VAPNLAFCFERVGDLFRPEGNVKLRAGTQMRGTALLPPQKEVLTGISFPVASAPQTAEVEACRGDTLSPDSEAADLLFRQNGRAQDYSLLSLRRVQIIPRWSRAALPDLFK
jgi:hypothetical protein